VVLFRKMVVAGVGLLGGSLAWGARERGLVEEVVGYGRSAESLRIAKRKGLIDAGFMRPGDFPPDTDFLVLATPVLGMAPLARQFAPRIGPRCIVSDVGSVKGAVVRAVEKALPPGVAFVGAHPIAGSEKSGPGAAAPDLFRERRCILTPTAKTERGALRRVACFWSALGAKVEVMDPDLHDEVLAVVSHLPHVAAYALVRMLERARADALDPADYCGGGFKDTTRIAASRAEIWRDICLANRRALVRALDDYIRYLARVRRWIREGRGAALEREFSRAAERRRELEGAR
jgi:prephenate dehydrogenase